MESRGSARTRLIIRIRSVGRSPIRANPIAIVREVDGEFPRTRLWNLQREFALQYIPNLGDQNEAAGAADGFAVHR